MADNQEASEGGRVPGQGAERRKHRKKDKSVLPSSNATSASHPAKKTTKKRVSTERLAPAVAVPKEVKDPQEYITIHSTDSESDVPVHVDQEAWEAEDAEAETQTEAAIQRYAQAQAQGQVQADTTGKQPKRRRRKKNIEERVSGFSSFGRNQGSLDSYQNGQPSAELSDARNQQGYSSQSPQPNELPQPRLMALQPPQVSNNNNASFFAQTPAAEFLAQHQASYFQHSHAQSNLPIIPQTSQTPTLLQLPQQSPYLHPTTRTEPATQQSTDLDTNMESAASTRRAVASTASAPVRAQSGRATRSSSVAILPGVARNIVANRGHAPLDPPLSDIYKYDVEFFLQKANLMFQAHYRNEQLHVHDNHGLLVNVLMKWQAFTDYACVPLTHSAQNGHDIGRLLATTCIVLGLDPMLHDLIAFFHDFELTAIKRISMKTAEEVRLYDEERESSWIHLQHTEQHFFGSAKEEIARIWDVQRKKIFQGVSLEGVAQTAANGWASRRGGQ
ncbi:uncharacterized protein RCO7_05593 [Rhynchosporium graminicola]|uniref:Uncharacterized protein n=1 Tax=Rhynchosporium graminicola TaxID=2792576 RepID=A0A1E1L0A5_9HELO|nr:uncharacterized protein RCO7_05593 [Rhynchosporium commune]